jgi:hypothetical protein
MMDIGVEKFGLCDRCGRMRLLERRQQRWSCKAGCEPDVHPPPRSFERVLAEHGR